MTIHNQKPHPRVLFVNFENSEMDELQPIIDLFPVHKFITYNNFKVDQTEYDVAIVSSDADVSQIASHIFVIAFGTDSLGKQAREKYWAEFDFEYNVSAATEFIENDDLRDERLSKLIQDTLLSIYLNANSHHHGLIAKAVTHKGTYGSSYQKFSGWISLLSDQHENIFSGYAIRSQIAERPAELWRLPELEYDDMKRWVEYLLDRWRLTHPEIFSSSDDWKRSREWSSTEELRLLDAIQNAGDIFESARVNYETELQTLQNQLTGEHAKADAGARMLLTSQGDDLKDSVKSTLEFFGFSVEDYDETLSKQGRGTDKLQDLNVRTTVGEEPWISLVEVKGYKKGAKQGDLLKISRFEKRYMQENAGSPPNATWYVVNHDIEESPDRRHKALATNLSDVKVYAENDGLVIDTVDLFNLRTSVETGDYTNEQARDILTGQKGYFEQSKTIRKKSKDK
ncbi:MAG: hypothetical protein QG549_301 [Patescibacteria group bacterium]|nr:hypothetical protein [Patescibacteria group bacterium]